MKGESMNRTVKKPLTRRAPRAYNWGVARHGAWKRRQETDNMPTLTDQTHEISAKPPGLPAALSCAVSTVCRVGLFLGARYEA